MSTSNPFEKLSFKPDPDDEEQGEFKEVKGKEKNMPIGIEKKKKTRPQPEKVAEEDEEGFEEVGKNKKTGGEEGETEGKGEHKKRRGINYNTVEDKEYRVGQKPSRGRKFDRRSGTGRGKEIAKGGAGGKGTWGENPKNIARDYEKTNDEYYFDSALNPEKKERKNRPPRRPKKEDKKEGEGEGEDKDKENNNTEDKKEGEEEKKEEGVENKREKRERRQPEKRELKPEEKLDKPEGAISLEDYLKSKNKPEEEEKEKKEVKRVQDGKPLTKTEEKKAEVLGTSGAGRKKERKKKEKDVNQEEIDLNNQIGSNLKIGAVNERPPKGEFRGNRGGKKGGRGKKGGNQFHYDPKDFPEME